MYGSLPNSEQLKVFWTAPKDTRKIVVATNIAETSITIPGVVYGRFEKDKNKNKYQNQSINQSILQINEYL